MTAVGGIYTMGGGLVPHTLSESLGFVATTVSTVNIVGGFMVAQKMLDVFKRPTDPPEFYELYGLPTAAFLGGYGTSVLMGCQEASAVAATVSGLLCIGGIAGLANQSTARLGNVSGMCGVAFGVASCIGSLSWEP